MIFGCITRADAIWQRRTRTHLGDAGAKEIVNSDRIGRMECKHIMKHVLGISVHMKTTKRREQTREALRRKEH